MKKIVIFIASILLASVSRAAITYTVTGAVFVMDSSVGTFVFNSVTFGDIVGLIYDIEVKDTSTGNVCNFTGRVPTPSPLTAFPSNATVLNVITNDMTARKSGALACVAQKNNETHPDVRQNVSGVVGQTIAP